MTTRYSSSGWWVRDRRTGANVGGTDSTTCRLATRRAIALDGPGTAVVRFEARPVHPYWGWRAEALFWFCVVEVDTQLIKDTSNG